MGKRYAFDARKYENDIVFTASMNTALTSPSRILERSLHAEITKVNAEYFNPKYKKVIGVLIYQHYFRWGSGQATV